MPTIARPLRARLARVVLLAIVVSSSVPRWLHSQSAAHAVRPGGDSITIRTTEGTGIGFDLTPDGRTIVFDLLGQLWSLPVEGGRAVPLTDAVRDAAEDGDPRVSPDGKWIAFKSDRPQGRGLWLRSFADGSLRQLTDSNYWPNNEHVGPTWSPDSRLVAYAARWQLHVRDIVSGKDSVLHSKGLPGFVQPGSWSRDGSHLVVMASYGFPPRLYEMDLAAGRTLPLDTVRRAVQAPSYSPDASRIAYFAQVDSGVGGQLWLWTRGEANARKVAESPEWSNFPIDARVRWSPYGRWLYYSGDGKLWRVSADGGTPTNIPFSATLTIPRLRPAKPVVVTPSPGSTIRARGFTGLALAPDARRFAMLALGRLWVAGVGDTPRAVAPVPSTATGLSWSPDGRQVVWSAGRGGTEDLFATTIAGGATRHVTALRGQESQPTWSPDGQWIAFVHWATPALASAPWAGDTIGRRIRIVRADRATPATLADTRELGTYRANDYTSGDLRPSWNDSSTAVLSFRAGDWFPASGQPIHATWLSVDGRERKAPTLPYRPSFPHVGRGGEMTFVQGGQLWRTESAGATPRPLGDSAALYPSVSNDGTVLFVSAHGLQLRRTDGSERTLGWPLPLHVAAAPAPLLVRNVRLFDGRGVAPHGLRDLLIERGRISAIAAPGVLAARRGVAELDAAGRTAIPGLIDAHMHLDDVASLPTALYFGVTTVRDMQTPLAKVAAQRDAVLAGAMAGARVLVSGPSFYPSPTTGGWTGSDEWMPKDSATMVRGLELLRAFGGVNVKLRLPISFASGAMMARLTRASGLTVSGHCGNPLALVVAGVGEQQHLDGQCVRNAPVAHDDRLQLYRAAGIAGVPTIYLHGAHASAVRDTSSTHDRDVEPFLTPQLRLTRLGDDPATSPRGRLKQGGDARRGARWFHEMGLPLVLGSDAAEFPGAQHAELAELVSAGLTPAEALVAATSAAARVLGIDADVGLIAEGKLADLVLLDADPLVDITNTRKIWRVIQGGRVVDRDALRSVAAEGR